MDKDFQQAVNTVCQLARQVPLDFDSSEARRNAFAVIQARFADEETQEGAPEEE